jgi:hypothetical protein
MASRAAVASIHRAAEKVGSRKMGFRHKLFSETQLPEMPILGYSYTARRTLMR